MIKKLNEQLTRFMPLAAPLGVVSGVVLSGHLVGYAFLVPWIFAFITFSGSLDSSFKSLQKTLTNPVPMLVVLLVLHIVMPMWAWLIGYVAFHHDMFTVTGLLISMVIPTGITSFIWVSIHKGNIALTFATVLIDTLLSPFLVPYSLSLFVGEAIDMETGSMMTALIGMVVLPSFLAILLNHLTRGRVKEVLAPGLAPFSKAGLIAVIMINSSVVAPYLKTINLKLLLIAFITLTIAATGYFLSWVAGRLLKGDKETVIALTFTGGMRNISAGSVIAVTYFPAPVAVPVVLGMLFQQVLASSSGYLLERYF